jgi:hypothetical protein
MCTHGSSVHSLIRRPGHVIGVRTNLMSAFNDSNLAVATQYEHRYFTGERGTVTVLSLFHIFDISYRQFIAFQYTPVRDAVK